MDDYLREFSNNLVSDLGPLLALFGDSMTRQYLSECTDISDYIIFAMGPIGIITAVMSVIRVCGGTYMRAFIGRSREGFATAEVELCTSTGRDVCELFTKGGIVRALGRPSILELVYIQPTSSDKVPPDEERLWIYRKYLRNKVEDRWPHRRSREGHAGEKLKLSSPEEDGLDTKPKTEPDTDLPNLSLNVGIVKPPQNVFRAVAALGLVLQGGVLALAGVFARSGLLGASVNEDVTAEPKIYAPIMFIAGTVVMCAGMGCCAGLIGRTTDEHSDPRREAERDRLIWLQPGNQKVGDQTFESYAIFETAKQPVRRYIMSTTDDDKREHLSRYTVASVVATISGFIVQFIGLRGLNAWVSIAQLGVTIIMSLLRGTLRMKRRSHGANELGVFDNGIHGYELDWLAFSLGCQECCSARDQRPKDAWQDRLKRFFGSTGRIGHNAYSFQVTGGLPKSTEDAERNPARLASGKSCLQGLDLQAIFRLRKRLAQLTGNVPSTTLDDSLRMQHQRWAPELVACRNKSYQIARAVCDVAAVLFPSRDGYTDGIKRDGINLEVCISRSTGSVNEQRVVKITLRPPSGSTSAEWTIDVAGIEALLGLWVWSINQAKGQDSDNYDSTARIVSTGKGDEHWGRRTRIDTELRLLLGSDAPILRTTSVKIEAKAEYGLVNMWEWESNVEGSFWRREKQNPEMETPAKRFLGWQKAGSCLQIGDDGGEGPLKRYQVQYVDTDASTLNICAQEIYTCLVHSMGTHEKAQHIDFALSGQATQGRLVNDKFESALRSFVSQELGAPADAVLCLLSALGDKVRVQLSKMNVADIVATHLNTNDWEGVEKTLKWSILVLADCLDRATTNNVTPTTPTQTTDNRQSNSKPASQSETKGNPAPTAPIQTKSYRQLRPKPPSGLDIRMNPGPEPSSPPTEAQRLQLKPADAHDTHDIHETLNTPQAPESPDEAQRLAIEDSKDDFKRLVRSALEFYRRYLDGEKRLHPDFVWHGLDWLIGVCDTPSSRQSQRLAKETYADLLGRSKFLINALFNRQAQNARIRQDINFPIQTVRKELFRFLENCRNDRQSSWTGAALAVMQIMIATDNRSGFIENGPQGRSALSYAAAMGDYDLALLLVQNGAQSDYTNEFEDTPLVEAARNKDAAMIHLFLPFMGPNEAQVLAYRRLLFSAAKSGDNNDLTTAMEALARERASIDDPDARGGTPLSYAAEFAHCDVVRRLMEKGASAESQDRRQRTPLIWAVYHSDKPDSDDNTDESNASEAGGSERHQVGNGTGRQDDARIKVVVELQVGIALQALAARGKKGNETRARELILEYLGARSGDRFDQGWDTKALTSEFGEDTMEKVSETLARVSGMADNTKSTALIWAAYNGSAAQVKQLFHDSDRWSKDTDQKTALSNAAARGHAEVVEILLADSDPLYYRDNNGQSALNIAAENGHKEVVDALLKHMDPVTANDLDIYQQTPLSNAADGGYVEIVDALLKLEEVRVDIPSRSGETALIYAAVDCHVQVVRSLLAHRPAPDCRIRDMAGHTALCYAIAYCRRKKSKSPNEIITMLYGEDVLTPSPNKRFGDKALWHRALSSTKTHLRKMGVWRLERMRYREKNKSIWSRFETPKERRRPRRLRTVVLMWKLSKSRHDCYEDYLSDGV